MNTNPILSLDEETQVQALLNELKKFVTCVPPPDANVIWVFFF